MTGEMWEDIPGLDGYYLISTYGRIKRERRESVNKRGISIAYKEMIIAPRVVRTPNAYVFDLTYQLCANVTIERKQYCMSIRRLVYYCFVKKFDLADESVLVVPINGEGLDTKVTQYDFKGNRIARFLTLSDAANAVGAKSYVSISYAIRGKARSAFGYFWKKGWGKKKIEWH